MATKKISRKQLLKEPDEFITFTGRLIQVFNRYRSQITGVLIALVVLLTGIAGYRYYLHRSEAQSSAMLAGIQTEYAALLADKDAVSAYPRVKGDMDNLIRKYGARSSGKLARIIAGDYGYRAGQYAEAQAYYEQALESFPAGTLYHDRLLSSLAYTYLALENRTQARIYFEKMAAGGKALLADEALFNLAVLSATENQGTQSQKYWEQIVNAHENSAYTQIAREKSGQPEA